MLPPGHRVTGGLAEAFLGCTAHSWRPVPNCLVETREYRAGPKNAALQSGALSL